MSWRAALELPDAAATATLGGALATHLRAGDCVALSGELGAGKSALARAIIRGLTAADDPGQDPASAGVTRGG